MAARYAASSGPAAYRRKPASVPGSADARTCADVGLVLRLGRVAGVQTSPAIVSVTPPLLKQCLEFDHVAVGGSAERQDELTSACEDGRMRVATLDGVAVGFSIVAPWFFDVPFLALLYVAPTMRGRHIGSRLLEDFERAHPPKVFTSTNLSNAHMQGLLRRREWTPCGMLDGLDEGDPEVFFVRTI